MSCKSRILISISRAASRATRCPLNGEYCWRQRKAQRDYWSEAKRLTVGRTLTPLIEGCGGIRSC